MNLDAVAFRAFSDGASGSTIEQRSLAGGQVEPEQQSRRAYDAEITYWQVGGGRYGIWARVADVAEPTPSYWEQLQQLCRSIYIDVGDDSDISVTLVIGVIRQYVDVVANQSGSAREAGQSLVSDVSAF